MIEFQAIGDRTILSFVVDDVSAFLPTVNGDVGVALTT
jgi:hypothetical protein